MDPVYADSSFFVALKMRRDTFHAQAVRFYERGQEEVWLWSPWHRVEVFNTLRQLSLHPDRKRQLAPGESKAAIQQIETDVRVGYFTHMEADWRDVLRKFNDLSIEHGFSQPCRSADILHVAYATELSAERFIGFDDDQLALAKAAGLDTLRPR